MHAIINLNPSLILLIMIVVNVQEGILIEGQPPAYQQAQGRDRTGTRGGSQVPKGITLNRSWARGRGRPSE